MLEIAQHDHPLYLLQVCAVRDFVVKNIYSPRHFLDHANYDCGRLTESQLARR